MASARDYMVDPQTTGFGPPNMAAQLYGMIRGIPQAYQEGAENQFKRGQMARTEELQKPVVDENGQPVSDYNKLLEVFLQKSGGAGSPQALELSKFPLELGAQRQFQKTLENVDSGNPPAGRPAELSGQDPDLLKPRGNAPQLGEEPTEGTANPAYIGNQPQNLTGPTIMPPGAGGAAAAGMPQHPAPPPMVPTPVRTVQAPPLSATQLGRTPPGADPLAGPGIKSEAEIAAMREVARKITNAAAAPLIRPAQQKSALERAKQITEQADKAQALRDKIAGEINPAADRQKLDEEVRKGQIPAAIKEQQGIQGRGMAALQGNQEIAPLRTQMSNPDFFSGAGHELVKKFKEWSVSLGGNPNAASPMQEFRKQTLALLNEKIRTMTESGYSRIQLQEIKNLRDQIASEEITPATNRRLMEGVTRGHEFDIKMAKFAQQYAATHNRYLDAGWPAARTEFAERPENHLFTQQERDHPELIAPPYLPTSYLGDPAKIKRFIANQGLKKTDAIAVDDYTKPPGPDGVRQRRLIHASDFMK
jgi:hypothetical protein